jgi:DNA-binding NarL/FixJ family response regulator
MATILLIEPHPLLRLGLRHLLAQSQAPVEIIDLDPDDIPHSDGTWLLQADLVIYGMPPDLAPSWRPLEDLCYRLRPQRVLVLADSGAPTLQQSPMPDIVRGFLAKSCNADVLDAAIRLVLAGGECFPAWAGMLQAATPGRSELGSTMVEPAREAVPFHARGTVDEPGGGIEVEVETPSFGAHLLNITERQYEVLALLARGYPIKTISRLLNISVATTKTHACTLYQRLHVNNKGEAVYEALRRGAKLNWPGPAPAVRPLRELAPVCQAA